MTTTRTLRLSGPAARALGLLVLCASLGSARAQDPVETPDTTPDIPGAEDTLSTPAPARPTLPEQVVQLRLRDGQLRWGEIADHDPDGLQFRLLSHGGLVRVPWGYLDPEQSEQLRLTFGYVDVASEEYLIEVDRLLLNSGNEVLGVIESREGEHFVVRSDGQLQVLPKSQVQSITSGVQVPALDVYTREQLYAREAAGTPADSATAQLELAEFCESILDFGHAAQHYEQALDLAGGGELDADKVGLALERARAKAVRQEQIDYLYEVDILRKRGRYDDALKRLAAFEPTWPDSPLLEDARKKETQVLKAREREVGELVVRRWHYWMSRLAREAAREMDHASAVAYASEQMGQDIRARVLEDVQERVSQDFLLEQLEPFWQQRRRVRYQSTAYGQGTWLLGEGRALAGTKGPEEEAGRKPATELDAQRAALEEKIQRYLKNQQQARQARTSGEQAESYEDFWKTFVGASRANWILAYYVEFGGDLELRDHPHMRKCSSCGGRGVHEILAIGGGGQGSAGMNIVECPQCHGIGAVRRIYYR